MFLFLHTCLPYPGTFLHMIAFDLQQLRSTFIPFLLTGMLALEVDGQAGPVRMHKLWDSVLKYLTSLAVFFKS